MTHHRARHPAHGGRTQAIRLFPLTMLVLGPAAALAAETLVATARVPARTVLAAGDVMLAAGNAPGALTHPDEAIGLETRVMLYPGRPIRARDLVPPAAIERNEIVVLLYERTGLTIATEGRALARGAVGDRIRVMNIASRSTVTGRIEADGMVVVGPSQTLLNAIGER